MKPKRGSGFTIIELLVVIAIIGLLSAIFLVYLDSAQLKARDVKRLQNKKQVVIALNLYYQTHNSSWPPNEPHGNGAANGFSCFGPANETCWDGFYEGSDALVTDMTPFLPIFPDNNADQGTNAYNRLLYNAHWNGVGSIFLGPPDPPGAYLIWMQESVIPDSNCPSVTPVQHLDKYYYCLQYLGP
ncbi:MAG: type II secretion system protein [Candidatus Doudnabacteria bacterium]